nr:hypothetical protein [Tanacetum cinerariifolium]
AGPGQRAAAQGSSPGFEADFGSGPAAAGYRHLLRASGL